MFILYSVNAEGKVLSMVKIAEGPRSELGPMMQRLRQVQGLKCAMYDKTNNFVSGTF